MRWAIIKPVDAVGGQVFHIAVEQARAAAVKDAFAITNHGTDSSAGAGQRLLANSLREPAADRDADCDCPGRAFS